MAQPSLIKKNPRPHQQEAVDDTLNVLNKPDQTRASVVMACGTGKTMVQLWTAENLNPSRVVVFVPTLALLKQVRDEWMAENRWAGDLKSICVCSDKSITKNRLRDSADEDSSLADLGMTADRQVAEASGLIYSTTDTKEINRQIDLLQSTPDAPVVVFSTYQSADVLGAAMKERAPSDQAFDVGIFDEAHKTVGAEGKMSAFALHDANLEIRKRAFYTATPKVITQRKKNKEGVDKLASMDDVSLYGVRAHELSTSKAIQKKLIVDYKVVISIIDDSNIDKNVDRNSIKQLLAKEEIEGDLLDAKLVADQVIVHRTMSEFNLKKGVLYHRTIAAAENHARFGNENRSSFGNTSLELFSVSGQQSMAERKEIMDAFEASDSGVIANARCLTEGIDMPAVDFVAFMDPKKSAVDITQAVGRAMRNSKDSSGKSKEICYVLLPLHVKNGDDLTSVIEGEGFKKITEVLAALASNDDSLQKIFQEALISRGKGELDTGKIKEKVVVSSGVAHYIGQIPLELLTNAISTRLIDEVGDGWWERLGELAAYKEIHGNCNASTMKTLAGKPNPYRQLGQWCQNQRTKKENLSTERLKTLRDLGFSFDPLSDAWNEMFAKLQAYKAIHNDCNVSQLKIFNGEPNPYQQLGIWCQNQRSNKDISPERFKALDDLGFSFDPLGKAWDEMFAKLQAYKAIYNHCNASGKETLSGEPNPYFRLGVWCATQRSNKDKLSHERLNKLISIGLFAPIDIQQQPAPSTSSHKNHGISLTPSTSKKSAEEITLNVHDNSLQKDQPSIGQARVNLEPIDALSGLIKIRDRLASSDLHEQKFQRPSARN